MMSRAIWAAVIGIFLFQPAFAADRSPVVGDIGNPPELVIDGAKTFSPAEVAHSLLTNLDIANAMHPTAPLDELLQLLVSKTEDGYRSEGFGDVSVRIVQDTPPRLRLVIDEGPRYMAGEIQVVGAKTIDAEWLKTQLLPDRLAGRDPRKKSPAQSTGNVKHWPAGKPAWFRAEAVEALRAYIDVLLLYQERIHPKFNVEVTRDENTKTAHLRIIIDDEGPPAVVGAISVTGNKKNSIADVLDFLGVHEGIRYRGGLERQLEGKLSGSGRFLKTKVRIWHPPAPGRPLTLKIDLQEYEKAPLLREPLSREEAALAALGGWLNHFDEGDEEVIYISESKDATIELIIAPGRGAIAIMRPAVAADAEPPFALALVMTDDVIGLYSAKRERKIEAVPTPGRVLGSLEFTIHRRPPNADGQGRIKFGLGLRSSTHRRQHCKIGFEDTAVGMLSIAHEHPTEFSWENDILTAKYLEYQVKVDAKSGRLLESRVDPANRPGARILGCTGLFQRRLDEISKLTAVWPNDADPARPASATLEFLCDDALAWAAGIEQLAPAREFVEALSKSSKLGILKPMDRFLQVASTAPDDGFTVPSITPGEWAEILAGDPISGLIRCFAYRAIGLSDQVAPRGSWLWTAWRRGAFLAAGRQDHLYQDLHQLDASRDTGPLQFLTACALLRAFSRPEAAVRCGQEGMARLDLAHFRSDYSPLLNADSFLGESLLNTAHVLRQLDEREIESLCETAVLFELTSEASAKQFAECVKQLRERRDQPLPVAVSAVLDNCWETCLKQRVETALRDNLRAVRTARRDSPRRPDWFRGEPSPGEHSTTDSKYDPAADRFDFPSIRPNRR